MDDSGPAWKEIDDSVKKTQEAAPMQKGMKYRREQIKVQ